MMTSKSKNVLISTILPGDLVVIGDFDVRLVLSIAPTLHLTRLVQVLWLSCEDGLMEYEYYADAALDGCDVFRNCEPTQDTRKEQ